MVGDYEIPQRRNSGLRMRLQCRAPNASTVETLKADLNVVSWERMGETKPLNWEAYVRGDYGPHPDLCIGKDLVHLDDGSVACQGLDMNYSGLTYWEPRQMVETLLSYLKSHGCTDFQYEFQD